MGDMPETIEVLGRKYPVTLPSFTIREELAAAFAEHQSDGMMLRRVYAAAIGSCSQAATASRASYAKCGHNPLTFGGEIYAYLREKGASVEDVASVGVELLVPMLEALFPREEEVDAQAGFTPAVVGT